MASRGQVVAFGEYGLQSLERCWLDTKQIEAARVAVTRYISAAAGLAAGFPASPSPEAAGNPQGKGKGAAGILGGVIRPANVLFEWRRRLLRIGCFSHTNNFFLCRLFAQLRDPRFDAAMSWRKSRSRAGFSSWLLACCSSRLNFSSRRSRLNDTTTSVHP